MVADVIGGVAAACSEHGLALLGGETAEMPGFYGDGEYDLAGFIVGLVDRKKILDGSAIRAGDVLIGLPASGLHTNGFSLARKVLFDDLRLRPEEELELCGCSVAEELLKVHRCYLEPIQPLGQVGHPPRTG